jgi:hypothetical protein
MLIVLSPVINIFHITNALLFRSLGLISMIELGKITIETTKIPFCSVSYVQFCIFQVFNLDFLYSTKCGHGTSKFVLVFD